MKFIKCTQCGAIIQKNADGLYKCEYCGSVAISESEPQEYNTSKSYTSNYESYSQPTYTSTTKTTTTKEQPKGSKDKWISVLLCLFGGYLGLHRFYEGKIFTGIVWLCTAGLSGVGIVIDLLILLCKPRYYYPR